MESAYFDKLSTNDNNATFQDSNVLGSEHRVAAQREDERRSGFRGVRKRESLDEVPLCRNPHPVLGFRKREQGVSRRIGDPDAFARSEDGAAHGLGVVILHKDFQERKSVRKGGGHRFRESTGPCWAAKRTRFALQPSKSACNSKQTQP